MEQKRCIPYGVINWATLVHECHFVDNTAYIRKLEPCRTPVYLRPKRFGKSIVCSMLAHYYDIDRKDQFEDLFGKTEIGREPTPLRLPGDSEAGPRQARAAHRVQVLHEREGEEGR